MNPTPFYQWLAATVGHHARCNGNTLNTKWSDITKMRITQAVKNHMPSGSGFDRGTRFDLSDHFDENGKVKPFLKFIVEFHHMNDGGYYDGWTAHVVTVRPSLSSGFDLTISGRNRDGIKDYIAEIFDGILRGTVTPVTEGLPHAEWHFDVNGRYLCDFGGAGV